MLPAYPRFRFFPRKNAHRTLSLLTLAALFGCQPDPPTLFEKIPPSHSGIRFTNHLTPSDSLNAFTFTNFYNGGGVGVGDFNRDGRPDLFFTGNQESCRLYVNEGDFKFPDKTESAGVKTDLWCTGVSVADVNADGWDDLYVCVAAHPTMRHTRNLLFINQKTASPTFREQAAEYGLDFAGFSTQAAFFDYDLDGDLDCFLLNTAPDLQNPNTLRPAINDGSYPSTDRLFRNEGPTEHPAFRDVSEGAGIRYEGLGLGLVVADFNGDGFPDLYGSNDFVSSDILYLNRGDGTFENTIAASMGHTSLFGMGVDAADVNNDGRVDLLQLDMLPRDNARLKQMLGAPDFDKKEISLQPRYGYQLQYMRNALQLNLESPHAPEGDRLSNQSKIPSGAWGLPRFSEIGLLAGVAQTDWSWAALLADYDGDGWKDAFITTGYRKNVTDRDFISYTEEFSPFGTDQARAEQREKLLERVPEIKLRNMAFRNRGDLTFEDVSKTWGLDELSYANGAAHADLDGDGDLDLVVNNIDQEASVFRNQSRERNLNNFLTLTFEGPVANRAGIGARVTVFSGGKTQTFENFPVRGYLSSVSTGLVVGLGRAAQADSVRVVWPGGATETRRRVGTNQRVAFRAAEARAEPAPPSVLTPTLFTRLPDLPGYQHQESDFVDFKTTPALHKMFSRTGPALAVGDLNGDGLDDVAVGASYRGSAGVLFFGKPGGAFTRQDWMPNTPMEVGAILVFDPDRDGDNDLLVVGGGNERPLAATEAYAPQLYRNDGRGHFTAQAVLPNLAVSSQCVRALDYDRDGDLDVLIAGRQIPGKYPLPARSYLLRNDAAEGRSGHFTDVTAQIGPGLGNLGLLCDALPLDVDGDRDDDLVMVGEWMPVTVLKNENGKFIQHSGAQRTALSIQHSSGWYNGLAAGDFDHDGDPDLLLGNEGLNTLYRASPAEPVQIVGKDFNDDGLFDPLLGYVIDGTRYPALPRDALNQQLVQFRRKFLHYADYAKAGFDDLFSKNDLEGAWRGDAQELRSCYAENLGGGNFALHPLPMLAQVAPIWSFVVRDFDGDGHLDALATGNFYGNEANMGRQDASPGLLLRGDGRGNFTALGPDQTGFRVAGDARRSYLLHNPDRVVTAVNGGGVKVQGWSAK